MRIQGHSQSKKYLLSLESDKLHKIFRDVGIKDRTAA